MRIALIADVFPPLRSSGAVQLRDLSAEFVRQGYEVTVLTPAPDLKTAWHVEHHDGVRICRLKSPRTKDINYAARALGELTMPYAMLRNLRLSPLKSERWDGVVWYSPTIFLGPLAKALKQRSGCRGYLIVRDIFPEWAVDMGLMRRGPPYYFFKAVEQAQYRAADVIGVQSPSSLPYFARWARDGRRIEVLQNWLAVADDVGCSIDVGATSLAGRKIVVYAGNMGVAQGLDLILDLSHRLEDRADVGFVFVGRGTEKRRLEEKARALGLSNLLFFDEIDPSEIEGLYRQCHVGIVALDRRHKTNNIPGKFLSYMHAGLPVMAAINRGNDLADLIAEHRVGRATTSDSADDLAVMARELIAEIDGDATIAERCRALGQRLFAPETAVGQIVAALQE